MAVWQWRLRTTQWRDTTFSCPIKRLCYRKLTLKNCTLPPVCSWGYRLQSHFSSRLLSESEWRTTEAGPIFSFSLYFRPAKKAKTAFNNITIGKEGHKDQMCNNLFSLFVADILFSSYLKHFSSFNSFFQKFLWKFFCLFWFMGSWAERNLLLRENHATLIPIYGTQPGSEKFEFFVNSS